MFQKEKKQWLGTIGQLDLKRSTSEEQLPSKKPGVFVLKLE
jgi:hypothetical protein